MKTYAIIPAYMEEKTIATVVEETKNYVDKVVVVDDGSTDNTTEYALGAGADITLKHPINMNKGFAVSTGIEAAILDGAEVLVLIDADCQHDPKDIPRFTEKLVNENLDIVFGIRDINQNMPLIRRIGNNFLSTSTYALYGIKLRDTQSGFRAFTSDAYQKIKWHSKDYRMESEMIAKTSKNKLKYGQLTIKTVYHDKYKGATPIDGIKIFLGMLTWRIIK